jgi:hypothetical protein
MTKTKVAKSKPTRTKRTAEKPAAAEIKRAAERAGIPVHEVLDASARGAS